MGGNVPITLLLLMILIFGASCLKQEQNKEIDNMQIGIQLYNLRDIMKNSDNFEQIIKSLKSFGYDGVELSRFLGENDVMLIVDLLNETGLKAISRHEIKEKIENNTKRVIEFNLDIKNKYVIVPFVPSKELNDMNKINALAKFLNEKGEELKKHGLNLLYHNHGQEFYVEVDGRHVLEHLLEKTDSAYVNFELDVYWVKYGGGDPSKIIRKYPGRFPLIHLKDGILKEPIKFRELGQGEIDIKSVIKAAKADGKVEWLIYEQDGNFKENPLESAKQSLEWLKSNFQ